MTYFIPGNFEVLVKDNRAGIETRYSSEFPIKSYKGFHGHFVLILIVRFKMKA